MLFEWRSIESLEGGEGLRPAEQPGLAHGGSLSSILSPNSSVSIGVKIEREGVFDATGDILLLVFFLE